MKIFDRCKDVSQLWRDQRQAEPSRHADSQNRQERRHARGSSRSDGRQRHEGVDLSRLKRCATESSSGGIFDGVEAALSRWLERTTPTARHQDHTEAVTQLGDTHEAFGDWAGAASTLETELDFHQTSIPEHALADVVGDPCSRRSSEGCHGARHRRAESPWLIRV